MAGLFSGALHHHRGWGLEYMAAPKRFADDPRKRAKDRRKPVREPNKQKTISIVEVRSFRCPPAKHIDLLPQDQDFRLQLCSRLEERSQDAENQLEQILHQVANLPRLLSASMLNLIFGTHTSGPMKERWPETIFHAFSKSVAIGPPLL